MPADGHGGSLPPRFPRKGRYGNAVVSIEGKRGLPRHRPPYVAEVGLFGRPTLVQNVETMYWVRDVVEKGPEWFASQGRHGGKGLRSYSVSGRVKSPGVKLAPAGITLHELIDEFCDGMAEGHTLRGYLPGGASGGVLPASIADLLQEFGKLAGARALLESLPRTLGEGVRVVRAPCMSRCDTAPAAEVGHRHLDHADEPATRAAIDAGDFHPVIPEYRALDACEREGGYAPASGASTRSRTSPPSGRIHGQSVYSPGSIKVRTGNEADPASGPGRRRSRAKRTASRYNSFNASRPRSSVRVSMIDSVSIQRRRRVASSNRDSPSPSSRITAHP